MGNKHVQKMAALAVIIVVISAVAILRHKSVRQSSSNNQTRVCTETTEDFEVNDEFARGFFEMGSKIKVAMNAFACSQPKAGQFVLYQYSHNQPPVVRRVVAVEGDEFHISKSKQYQAWQIEVNGKVIQAGAVPYTFGVLNALPNLATAEKQRDGRLGHDEVIVLATIAPGQIDSSIFGVVNSSDLVARVISESAPQKR
jgi:type IV secretory pathway protease TraF